MNSLQHTLRLHEENYRSFRQALGVAGGDLDLLLEQPLSDVLRSLALNDIRIYFENKASASE